MSENVRLNRAIASAVAILLIVFALLISGYRHSPNVSPQTYVTSPTVSTTTTAPYVDHTYRCYQQAPDGTEAFTQDGWSCYDT